MKNKYKMKSEMKNEKVFEDEGTRTPNLLIWSQPQLPIVLRPQLHFLFFPFKIPSF